jgi:hypothetical protein
VGTRQLAVVLDDGGAFLEGFAIVSAEAFRHLDNNGVLGRGVIRVGRFCIAGSINEKSHRDREGQGGLRGWQRKCGRASGCRDGILGTHGQKVGIDAFALGDEDHDAEIAVAGDEDHFVAAVQFLQDFEAWTSSAK